MLVSKHNTVAYGWHDSSIYRDTFPAIRIAIIFVIITIFFLDFCKVIPQIHNYFVKIFCEILIGRN